MDRKLVILTEGHSNPHAAKTACSVIRYRAPEVLAVLDSDCAGSTTQDVLGVGGEIPFISRLDEAPEAKSLLIGIAPPGGRIPESWRRVILEAIDRGMDVISGLHDHLADDPEFAAAAEARGVELQDVRRSDQRQIARRQGLREDCLRVHTVGHDCSVGKMVTSIEIDRELRRRGVDSRFLATGQTGILVQGDGVPIDCIVADFVSGAAERLVLEHQHHQVVVVEGQGSLVHPSYSGVTLGLLHGCAPHVMIFCYEVGRRDVTGIDGFPIPPLSELLPMYETMARVVEPSSRIVGIAMNSRLVSPEEAEAERERIRESFGLPVCDVFRHGAGELVDAVEACRRELQQA